MSDIDYSTGALMEAINNKVDLDGIQTITGQKTFEVKPEKELVIKNNNIDSANPTGEYNRALSFVDKNGLDIGSITNNILENGEVQVRLTAVKEVDGERKTASLGSIILQDGSPFTFANTPSATASSQAIATTEWVNDKLFLDVTKRTTLSVSLNTAFTITNNGYLALSIKVGSQTDSKVNVLLANSGTATSSSYTVCTVTHNGGSAESNTTPVVIPVKKNQSVYLNYNNAGSATVMSAYLFRNS